MHKKYLIRTFIIFSVLMFFIGSINFIVDPGAIYLKRILANKLSSEFSNKILNSTYGIVQNGMNPRLIKASLAKNAGEFDCVILGSSNVLQISSVRNTGNITKQCNKILNLGVTKGTLEDISILSYLILNNVVLPKKVFIGMTPWTFKFGFTSQYAVNEDIYIKMNDLLKESENDENVSYIYKLAENLFNGEYLKSSLKELFVKENEKSNDLFKNDIIFPTNKFSYKLGYKKKVILPDGSRVYAANWIINQKNKTVKMGGKEVAIKGQIYDMKAIKYLEKIVTLYKENGIEVRLIKTPYHPNVFKKGNTKAVIQLNSIEPIIDQFSEKLKLKTYGSFFPDKIGCESEEFFDYVHPSNECLNRIDFSK